jgi:succinoglycan biosynthesis protein ExoU
MNIDDSDVCVIIAAFNAQETIGRAVNSALAQGHVREVIVADDASQDQTADRARQHDDGSGRLVVLTLRENKGPAFARNAALQSSKSPLVCTLDADDYFLPDRIARLLIAASTAQWDMIADDILIVPQIGQNLDFAVVNSTPPRLGKSIDLESFVRGNISHPRRPRDELGFLKPIIRRNFLTEHGLRYDERLHLGEDYALYARALIAGARFLLANSCGYIAIERHDSISSLHSAKDLANIAAFDAECLRGALPLSNRERKALAAHRAATLQKCDYRALLDYKRERGVFAALARLATTPNSIPYIAGETIKARAMRLFGHENRQDNKAMGFRFLIGVPETQLSLPTTE